MNVQKCLKAATWIIGLIRKFLQLEGPHHAAAMAFFAMLALVPGVLLLANALAQFFVEVPVEGGTSPLDQTLDGLEMALPAFKGSVRNVVADLAAKWFLAGVRSLMSCEVTL